MSDEDVIVVQAFPVRRLKQHPATPLDVVLLLESCGGDLKRFIDTLLEDPNDNPDLLLCRFENLIRQDPKLLQRWNDSIKSHMTVRLRLLQTKALERFELYMNPPSDEHKMFMKANEELAFIKFALTDFMAGQTHGAKKTQQTVTEDDDDSDDEDLAAVMAGA